MKLKQLLKYNEIVIQCHDNPDADAIACGFAVYKFFANKGKKVSLVYGGRNIIRKSNLVMMVEELAIPIKHVKILKAPELLLTVDCQYGEGNVTRFKARNVATIDHHRAYGQLPVMNEIRSYLGACSTLVWKLLEDEGMDINSDKAVATALYYGLFSDTNSFTEISHPLDKDLRDYADFDANLLTRLRNANMSLEELEIAGTALLKSDYVEDQRYALVKAGPCDPNVLGIISDMVLGVDAIDVCIVFNVMPGGVKLSVRSCIKEVKANELAETICMEIGSGGGHFGKAGGFIPIEHLVPEYIKFCKKHGLPARMKYNEDGSYQLPTESAVKTFIEGRVKEYMENTEIIYSGTYDLDTETMDKYISKPLPKGYVFATDIGDVGTLITVRTVEGDIDTEIVPGLIFIIDSNGEVTLTSDLRFTETYRLYKGWKFSLKDAQYQPNIKINMTNDVIPIQNRAYVCVPKENVTVYAKTLDHKVKVFSRWDDTIYTSGKEGDILFVKEGVTEEISTMKKEDFKKSYTAKKSVDQLNGYKAVIFDLDGTLLDTLEDLKNAVNAALREYNMPERSLEEVRIFVGNGVKKLMKRAVPDGDKNPDFEAAFSYFKEYYSSHCLDNTKPYHDIKYLIKELKARGIKMAIVSNKMDPAVKELSNTFFKQDMSAAIGECKGVKRKPAPDTALKALKELGLKPEEAVYVGDSDVDIETAQNAGMRCISVSWGFRDTEFLMKHGATDIIDTPMELLLHL